MTLFFGDGFEGVPVMATACDVRLTMNGAESDLVFVARKQGQGGVARPINCALPRTVGVVDQPMQR